LKKKKSSKEESIDRIVLGDRMEEVIKAFDTRDWLTDEEVDITMNAFQKEEAPKLKCDHCGYVWIPDPRKWRQKPEGGLATIKGKDVKILFCPSCGVKLKVPISYALYIWTWWSKFLREWQAFKERMREARRINYKVDVRHG
jgi:hypothetical protein